MRTGAHHTDTRGRFWISALCGVLVAGTPSGCGKVNSQLGDDQDRDVLVVDVAPGCVEGDTRCQDDVFEICSGGTYVEVMSCEQGCDPVLGCAEDLPDDVKSFIWIANSQEGTLSKIDTRDALEVARYRTCPPEITRCDPSRTSVNLHGDVVVTNRIASPSSVTKFAASLDDCVDRNGNGTIETSTSGFTVYPWGEDECMLWNSELPHEPLFHEYGSHGARATAWDGEEDPDTGTGGHVWIGTCMCRAEATAPRISYAYKLNGDTGALEERILMEDVRCAYGAAVDGNGGVWFFDKSGQGITRLDMATHELLAVQLECGYGITVDSQGRVWTGGRGRLGSNCVSQYDPVTDTELILWVEEAESLRGIAVGVGKSEGYVWVADTPGTLFQIDATTMQVVGLYTFGSEIEMIGVAVDYQGYVWTVAEMANAAFKYDPETQTHTTVPIGLMPYTYSDMTGVQLRNAVIVR